MINVTKTYLPPYEEYAKYLEKVWQSAWVTNNGPLVKELEQKLKGYLGVKHILFCNNGTIAIQLAIRALRLEGEIITTPFSYVATTNSILWENCAPVFADVRPDDLCIDVSKIEAKITPRTVAIMAVHVYGYPCDTVAIEALAKKHGLKVIYDAAHAFGCVHEGRSLLSWGDVSTCSFHATKLFHTGEGGAVVTNDDALAHHIRLLHQFGHIGDDYYCMGVNGKSSELHAAMGLAVFPHLDEIIAARKNIFAQYDRLLDFGKLSRPHSTLNAQYNYAYYPVLFRSEEALLRTKQALLNDNVNTRRYFYPSLNRLPFLDGDACPVSEDAALRVLALPLFYDLATADVERISAIINAHA